MISSTTRSKRSTGGFTLVEIMIGSTLGTMILAAVLSTFLMLGRSGANVVAYSTMEAQSRRALEEFSQDLRMASDITWNGTTSVTLLVPDNYPAATPTHVDHNRVTYAYNSATKAFYRMPGIASSNNTKTTLIKNVSALEYSRYDRVNNPIATTETSNVTTKRIRVYMLVSTKEVTVARATNTILSASYILRNKPVN